MYDVNHLINRHNQEMSLLKKSLYTSLAREKHMTMEINKRFTAACSNGFTQPQTASTKFFSALVSTLAVLSIIFIS